MTSNIQEEIEDKVIDCINAGVNGRLIIVKPEKNKFGADLAVERRGNYKEGAVYFQINSLVGPVEGETFIKDFLKDKFKADKNFYLLFVYFDEIRQKISDSIWLVPSLHLKDTAKIVQSEGGEKMLEFGVPLDTKNKNEYSKFVVLTKGLGKFILDSLEKGGKFDFGENEYEKKSINLSSLKEFLCEARRNTYASGASSIGNQRLLASYEFEFQKGDYFYRDVYFSGDEKRMGQEIIYLESKPIWGMNYVGKKLGKLETEFLKESLFKLAEKCRFGGECKYEKRELVYSDKGQGNLDEFFGQEEISVHEKSIYKLNYQGGLI